MGRPKVYTPEMEARVAAMVAKGMTVDAVYASLKRSGKSVSRATVGRMVGRLGTQPATTVAVPDAPEAEPVGDLLGPLRELIPKLTEMVERAMVDDESQVVNAGLRTLSQLTAQLARLEPPIPPDPNDHPDMVAAARACRAKLVDYVERARGGKS